MNPKARSFAFNAGILLAWIAVPVAVGIVLLRSASGCDVESRTQSVSPDGKWRIEWHTEGCHGVLLTTEFNSKVLISDAHDLQPENATAVFESDGSDSGNFRWDSPMRVNIQVGGIAEVTKSLRSYRGIAITYSVPAWVSRNLEQDAARRVGIVHQGDSKQAAQDMALYIARFRKWMNEYATTDSQ